VYSYKTSPKATTSFVINTIWNNCCPIAEHEEQNKPGSALSLLLRYGEMSWNMLNKTRKGAV